LCGNRIFLIPQRSRNPANLKLSWKTLGAGHFAHTEHGYYLVYRNIDPESKEIRWSAKFESLSGYFLLERWNRSQFFEGLEDAQLFCEEHAEDIEQ
jgi:hypothetical protein